MRLNKSIAVKICGITSIEQAEKIAKLEVNAIGVIGVKSSPRYVNDHRRKAIFRKIRTISTEIERVLVVANIGKQDLENAINSKECPTVFQLHGQETPEECFALKKQYPKVKFWKALRIQSKEDLFLAKSYTKGIDAVLLDSWDPKALGGTGKRIPEEWLYANDLEVPWWLAGGVSEEWIKELPENIYPYGVDASSRLEISPGLKDIEKVKSLIRAVKSL